MLKCFRKRKLLPKTVQARYEEENWFCSKEIILWFLNLCGKTALRDDKNFLSTSYTLPSVNVMI